jgi:hypothetical protein
MLRLAARGELKLKAQTRTLVARKSPAAEISESRAELAWPISGGRARLASVTRELMLEDRVELAVLDAREFGVLFKR